jgi:hypothetical protein
MRWKRRSHAGIQELAEERKVLAERYTIDAEEAQRREQLAIDAAAREAEEQARRAIEAERERKAAEERARRAAEAEPAREVQRAADPQPQPVLVSQSDAPGSVEIPARSSEEPEEEEPAANAALPIYRWIGRR